MGHCCSHTYCPQPPWRGCCWESAVWQKTCSNTEAEAWAWGLLKGRGILRGTIIRYLTQPSQSMLPVVSLMVRSETKAGYSVSHGTIMVLPRDLWAACGADRNNQKRRDDALSSQQATCSPVTLVINRKLNTSFWFPDVSVWAFIKM